MMVSLAAAQEAPPPTTRADEITVTATRQAAQVLDVPSTVTVVNRRQLDNQIVRDTQDLVRYQPGILVDRQTSGTDPAKNFSGFTIRGVGGNRVQMLVDGMRVIERNTDGTRDFIDLAGMKAVEFARGPGSVLWGADALGGIVAYRTLDPDDLLAGKNKNWALRLSSSFDSFDNSFNKTAIFAQQFTPTLQGLIMLGHKHSEEPKFGKARANGGIWGCPTTTRFLPCNKVDPLDINAWNVMAKLVFRPSADNEFKFAAEYYDKNTRINQLWDFGVVSGGIRNGEWRRSQTLNRQRYTLSHNWNVASTWFENIKWNIGFSPQERELEGARYQTLANGNLRRTQSLLRYKEQFVQGDLQFTTLLKFWGTDHRLTYGFQGDLTATDYLRQDIVTNLTTNVTTVTRAGGFNFANSDTRRADIYLQDEIKVWGDRLTLTPGVRLATYRITPRPDADYIVVPGAAPRTLNSTRFIPQIGAVLKLNENYSVFARYAEGFKMPTAEQLYTSLPSVGFNLVPNPNLKPESVRSYEAGLRGQFEKGYFSLGVFHADYTDFIQNFVSIPGTIDITYQNLSSVKVSGIEFFGQYAVTDRLTALGSFSYQYGTQRATTGAVKTPFNGASPFSGTIGLRYAMPEHKLEFEATSLLASGVNRAAAPVNFKPGGYAVFDAFVGYTPWENVKLRAGVMNIFDKRYFPSSVTANYNKTATAATAGTNPLELQTAPGRTYRVSLQTDF
jgi:hemoglobin/transferrin/lactoferrin receptor protein